MKARGWKPSEVGALRIAYDQLPTGRDRTMGAADALKAAGVPAKNVIDAPQTKTDTESAYNAANIAFTKNPTIKHWVAFGLNDEAVMGAVRAAEGRGLRADSVIGVGIGGSKTALNEFAKPTATGFFGTVMISAKRHGYETSTNLYDWIASNKLPPAETQTSGFLVNRANLPKVRAEMGI
jgi:L-arabinose transport system substrate-binding protein